jgi:glycosyltransferase 2 family protein
MATVVIERLFDGLIMLLFVFAALPFVRMESGVIREYQSWVVGFTVLFLLALGVFLFVAARPHLAQAVYEPIVRLMVPERFRPRVLESADRFMHGFASLGRGREVVMIFGTTVLVWLCETGKYWFVMHAFPFQVSFITLMLMNGIVNLFTTIPAAPGYVGTFDLPGIRILRAAGVPQDVATAYTLVLHVSLWLPVTVLGAYYMWRSHLSVRQIQRELAEDPGAAGPEDATRAVA